MSRAAGPSSGLSVPEAPSLVRAPSASRSLPAGGRHAAQRPPAPFRSYGPGRGFNAPYQQHQQHRSAARGAHLSAAAAASATGRQALAPASHRPTPPHAGQPHAGAGMFPRPSAVHGAASAAAASTVVAASPGAGLAASAPVPVPAPARGVAAAAAVAAASSPPGPLYGSSPSSYSHHGFHGYSHHQHQHQNHQHQHRRPAPHAGRGYGQGHGHGHVYGSSYGSSYGASSSFHGSSGTGHSYGHQHGHQGPQHQSYTLVGSPASAAAASTSVGGGGGGGAGPRPWLHATRAQWSAAARVRLHAVKSAGGAASSQAAGGTLQAGCLVEFEKNDRGVLGLVTGPDGKKNWFVVDQSGRRSSIQPKQVTLLLPPEQSGRSWSEADLAAFAAAAEAADASLMEIAWEIALDGGAALDLSELASLLFDDTSPRSRYVTHRLLAADGLFFKQASKSPVATYTARKPEDVATLRKQQEEAEAARREAEGWKGAVAAAKAAKTRAAQPSAEEWQTGPFAARIAAIKAVALSGGSGSSIGGGGGDGGASSMALALSSLQLAGAGSRAEPEAAAALLTDIGVWRRHEPLPLLRRGLTPDFPPDVERAAQALLDSPPPDPDAGSREDLTHLRCFTIDDAATTEVDDGLSLERLAGGGIRIWIHVADPTRWIQPDTQLDMAGRQRGRTLYLPWGSVPMFPRALAEGPFSLREGQVCDALSVGVELRPDGSVAAARVAPSRVRVSHKLTYDSADAALGTAAAAGEAGDAAVVLDAEALADLQELRRAATLRREYREGRGCIEIPLPEAKIQVPYEQLDRARPAVTITRISQWESASRSLVAEMMILTGEAVGTVGAEAELPLPYRGQDEPELPPAARLAALPDGPCRGFALKRCMTRSTVAAAPQRHAALALDAYVQFTSPIRRYSDMLAHYNLKAWLRGEPLPFSGRQIEAVMEAAAEAGRELGGAERESEGYWIAEYLRLRWGSDYPAMALGWQREEMGLVAFLLEDQGLEVVAKVPSSTAWAPGDKAVLAPSEANPATGFYRFYVVGWTSGHAAGGDEDEEGDEDGEEVVEVLGGEEGEEKAQGEEVAAAGKA